LHGGLLRTRRAWLGEQGDAAGLALAARLVPQTVCEDEPRLAEMWAALDDWRRAAAERAEANRSRLVGTYRRLAAAVASDRADLAERVVARLHDPDANGVEHEPLRRLLDLAREPGHGRLPALPRPPARPHHPPP